MPLPRNALARNSNTHLKNLASKEIEKKVNALNTICENNKIGPLTFKSCKFASKEGKLSFVDYEIIKGNMRSGIMVIKANSVSQSENAIYDIVEIENNKKAADEKKHHDDLNKAKLEIDRLKNNSSTEVNKLENADPLHKDLLMKLVNESETKPVEENVVEPETKPVEENVVEPETKPVEENVTEPETKPVEENVIEPENKPTKKDKSAKAKRQRALARFQEEMKKKALKASGNKYFRKFMSDIKSKFTLQRQPDYKFVDFKTEATEMVIDGAQVYQIKMPEKTKETYFLVLGDLQAKSGLIRKIDPNYKSEKFFQDQSDFLENIKAKENAKIKVAAEDILDKELDEDDLELSDDETLEDTPELVSPEVADLMNPEFLESIREEGSVTAADLKAFQESDKPSESAMARVKELLGQSVNIKETDEASMEDVD